MSSSATAAPNEPRQKPRQQRRGYRRHPSTYTTLTAHGEPLIWLTGGALITAIIMIVGVLGLIIYQGASTFWPQQVQKLTLANDQVYVGEFIESESVEMSKEKLANLPSMEQELFKNLELSEKTPTADVVRWKFRGSDESNGGRMNRWCWAAAIKTTAQPEWAVVVERANDAKLFGEIVGFADREKTIATDPGEVWTNFEKHHAVASKAFQKSTSLRKHDIGAIDRRVQAAQLTERKALRRLGPNETESADLIAARKELAETLDWKAEQRATVEKQIAEQETIADQYKLQVRVHSGGEKDGTKIEIPLGSVVSVVTPNRVGWFSKAGTYLSRWWEFLLGEPRESNMEGGVFPCIWGTVAMTMVMSLLVSPFGVLAALYLREYAKGGTIVSLIRIAINNLAGVPSIVFGAFGLAFFCNYIGVGIDDLFFPIEKETGAVFGKGGLLWAALTMALLTLPVVIVATEEALAAVPNSMREGSYACGASKWQTIRRIVLPRALPGIMTGLILAMARGAGEVAPLMLVGVMQSAPDLPVDSVAPFVHFDRGFMHLSYHIYNVGFSSPNNAEARPLVMTSTFLLIGIITLLNLVAVWIRNKLRKRFSSNQF